MNNHQIIKVIQECAGYLNLEVSSDVVQSLERNFREYDNLDLIEFIRDTVESGNDCGIIFLEKHLKESLFLKSMSSHSAPVMVFAKDDELAPVLITRKGKKYLFAKIREEGVEKWEGDDLTELDMACTEKLEVIFLAIFDHQSLVSSDKDYLDKTPVSAVYRLYKLLAAERQDILYVYIYAALIGLLGLSLPLGIQAAIELISGGVLFSSVYVLIAFIILGVIATGVLQVFQITIVEYLQRRVFTKAAFEFAFRVPRIQMESVLNLHMPELMNRFFDVITLQKGLPKLLIDLSTGIIQIIFGLILLSFYHPFFVFFGLGLLGTLFSIFYLTGPQGLKSSIVESKYKYKVVYWLEEMARTLYSFKLSGNTNLPIKNTDLNVNSYLKHRSAHFKVLIKQYSFILLFKVVVTGGLLIIGTILVINREITLGQFVASEVIIILIINSVEKIIMYMDVVYDMLTAVDKIAQVTDLPLEPSGGIDIPASQLNEKGLSVEIKNLQYTYPDRDHPSISDINLSIAPGEKICISGGGNSGKTTLTNVIAGIHTKYEGVITYNRYNLKDLDRTHLRDQIGKNVSQEDIFEGTILDNILVGKPFSNMSMAMEAMDKVGLMDQIHEWPEGFNTPIRSAGKGFSSSFINKLILARCLAKQPSLLILNDFFNSAQKHERLKLIEILTNPEIQRTLIVVSNDPLIMAAMDRVIYMDAGKIIADDTFENVLKNENILKNIY